MTEKFKELTVDFHNGLYSPIEDENQALSLALHNGDTVYLYSGSQFLMQLWMSGEHLCSYGVYILGDYNWLSAHLGHTAPFLMEVLPRESVSEDYRRPESAPESIQQFKDLETDNNALIQKTYRLKIKSANADLSELINGFLNNFIYEANSAWEDKDVGGAYRIDPEE